MKIQTCECVKKRWLILCMNLVAGTAFSSPIIYYVEMVFCNTALVSHMISFLVFPSSIIGTPGRLMHVVMEMNLKLQNVEYVVFDEADR